MSCLLPLCWRSSRTYFDSPKVRICEGVLRSCFSLISLPRRTAKSFLVPPKTCPTKLQSILVKFSAISIVFPIYQQQNLRRSGEMQHPGSNLITIVIPSPVRRHLPRFGRLLTSRETRLRGREVSACDRESSLLGAKEREAVPRRLARVGHL